MPTKDITARSALGYRRKNCDTAPGAWTTAADKIVRLHQSQDNTTQEEPLDTKRQARVDALRKEAERTRRFLASNPPRLNRKGQELKTNATDPDSAKMATGKGVIQGYAAQAAVAAGCRGTIIVARPTWIGSGSEQSMLQLPMIEQAHAHTGKAHTCLCITAMTRVPRTTGSSHEALGWAEADSKSAPNRSGLIDAFTGDNFFAPSSSPQESGV